MQVPREFESLNLRQTLNPGLPGFSLIKTMEYILFAFLALFASAGNTIFNRLGANHASALTNATVKSFFIVIACFLISLVLGHVPSLYNLSGENWLWIGLVGVLTAIDWFFYFLAIKRTKLEAFSNYVAARVLFLSNALFMIFTFSSVTNGGKPLNIVLYSIGLVLILISILFVINNKKINKSTKSLWIVFAAISTLAFAFLLVIVKLKLTHVPSDVISYHQMCICFVAMAVASLITKNIKELGQIRFIDHVYIFIGAVFNALLTIFRYTAFSYANSIPAIVNVIIGLDFIVVSFGTIIFFKTKNKVEIAIAASLVFVGMVLNTLAGLI